MRLWPASWLVRSGIILTAIILAFIIALLVWRGKIVRSNRIDPERAKAAREFLARKWTIDREAFTTTPVGNDFRKMLGLVDIEWENQRELLRVSPFTAGGSAYARESELVSDDTAATATEMTRKASGWMRNCSRLVRDRDYEMTYLLPMPPFDPEPAFGLASTAARLFCLAAMVQDHAGDFDEGFELGLDALRFGVRPRAAPAEAHAAGATVVRNSVATLADMAQGCRNVNALRALLATLQALYGGCNPGYGESAPMSKIVGHFRLWGRDGYLPELPAEMSGRELFDKWLEATEGYVEYRASILGDTHPEVVNMRLALEARPAPILAYRQTGNIAELKRWLGGEAVVLAAFDSVMPDEQQLHTEQDIARAAYDLTMLTAAQELCLLDSHKPATGMADLVPKYLPTVPKDPFSGTEYVWSKTMQRFYSLGPDRKDDGLKLLYAGGMTSSPGDLIVP